jgi:hypothetical protein
MWRQLIVGNARCDRQKAQCFRTHKALQLINTVLCRRALRQTTETRQAVFCQVLAFLLVAFGIFCSINNSLCWLLFNCYLTAVMMIMMTTSSAFTKANISQQIALTFINAVIY